MATGRLEQQARFWELVRSGSTFSQACDADGVDRRQGYRWRRASGGRLPAVPREVSGRFLSLQERLLIADLRLAGESIRAIAGRLGRAPSTISRELAPNHPEVPGSGSVRSRRSK
ncbi:helix-turn-helix domain-containing protein [Solicola sp. PLA-1-18]|uniref:helix-turn-helix domain-containing protein n=1 Tax=Solicola sp. PLA-1-18 TaxID=3380532 RepID=UPI003B7FD2CA